MLPRKRSQSSDGAIPSNSSSSMSVGQIPTEFTEEDNFCYSFSQCSMIQELSNELKPILVSSTDRKTCLNCHIAFSPPFVVKNHCRCCGELYCNKCTAAAKVNLPIYDTPVKICGFCFKHVEKGDFVSPLRCVVVLAAPDAPDAEKMKALVLFNFILDEIKSTRKNSADEYLLRSLGGFDNLWKVFGTTIENPSLTHLTLEVFTK
jgi:hypothetical protein